MQFKKPIEELIKHIDVFLGKYSVDQIWSWRERKMKQCQDYKFQFIREMAHDGRVDIINDWSELFPFFHDVNALYIETILIMYEIHKYSMTLAATDMNEPSLRYFMNGMKTILSTVGCDVSSSAVRISNETFVPSHNLLSKEYSLDYIPDKTYTFNPKYVQTTVDMYFENGTNDLYFYIKELDIIVEKLTHVIVDIRKTSLAMISFLKYLEIHNYEEKKAYGMY